MSIKPNIVPIPPVLMRVLLEAFGHEWVRPLDGLARADSEEIGRRRGIGEVMDFLNEIYGEAHGEPYHVFWKPPQAPAGPRAAPGPGAHG